MAVVTDIIPQPLGVLAALVNTTVTVSPSLGHY